MALKFANNQSLTSTTALPSAVPTDNLILISTQTASSSATISFTTGIDSTYDEYIFKFINIHGSANSQLNFNGSSDGGSNYNVTKTSTSFRATHLEDGSFTVLGYDTGRDLAQGTGFQPLLQTINNNNDDNACGFITIFNPSSTTYVKHFITNFNTVLDDPASSQWFMAGYFNTTSAINAVRFQMSSGNIDDGIIKMYGVKKS